MPAGPSYAGFAGFFIMLRNKLLDMDCLPFATN